MFFCLIKQVSQKRILTSAFWLTSYIKNCLKNYLSYQLKNMQAGPAPISALSRNLKPVLYLVTYPGAT